MRAAACPCTRGLSIAPRANINSLHALWPIRASRPTCANQDVRAFVTSRRPNLNSTHTATCHAFTRTLSRSIANKAAFSEYYFPVLLIRLWPSCHFDLEGSRHGRRGGGVFFVERADTLQTYSVLLLDYLFLVWGVGPTLPNFIKPIPNCFFIRL